MYPWEKLQRVRASSPAAGELFSFSMGPRHGVGPEDPRELWTRWQADDVTRADWWDRSKGLPKARGVSSCPPARLYLFKVVVVAFGVC